MGDQPIIVTDKKEPIVITNEDRRRWWMDWFATADRKDLRNGIIRLLNALDMVEDENSELKKEIEEMRLVFEGGCVFKEE